MDTPKFSYILTTYNKLPYLRQIMERLLKNRMPDDEIIVTDGGSTDGTKEYLSALHREGRIERFLSERDFGEGHGTNKALLMARGDLIKILTDDDDHFFPGIRACQEFMMQHPEIDFLSTEGASVQWKRAEPFGRSAYYKNYEIWKKKHRPFAFCGLGWMWRRTSLPLLGLIDTNFIRMDGEYSLRITAGKARIAWYTGVTWTRIVNRGSNTVNKIKQIQEETKRLDRLYGVQVDPTTWFGKAKSYLHPLKRQVEQYLPKSTTPIPWHTPDPGTAFQICDEWLATVHAKEPGTFLLP